MIEEQKEIRALKLLLLQHQESFDLSKLSRAFNFAAENYYVTEEITSELRTVFNEEIETVKNFQSRVLDIINNKIKILQTEIDRQIAMIKLVNNLRLQIHYDRHNSHNGAVTKYLEDDESIKNSMRSILHYNADFKYPALLLGDDITRLSDNIVSYDQVYVSFPEVCMNEFNTRYHPVYHNSIRSYNYKNNFDEIIDQLPKNQFACIAANIYIDMLPDSKILKMVENINILLRDGGMCVFYFFDILSEHGIKCLSNALPPNLFGQDVFLPSLRTINDYIEIFRNTGLLIENYIPGTTCFSIIKLRKPGVLKTVKAKKVIGEIIDV